MMCLAFVKFIELNTFDKSRTRRALQGGGGVFDESGLWIKRST